MCIFFITKKNKNNKCVNFLLEKEKSKKKTKVLKHKIKIEKLKRTEILISISTRSTTTAIQMSVESGYLESNEMKELYKVLSN